MKKGLRILLFSDAFLNLSLGMIGPIYAIFVEHIGGDILDASWAFFAYMFTAGVVTYIISKWEDGMVHKELLVVIGYVLSNIGCFAYIFVYDQFSLLVTQIILGLSMAVLSPAFDATYSHYVIKKSEASNWGIWEAMSYIVTAFAAIIGGAIVSTFGFQFLFIAMFVVSLFATIVSLVLLFKKKSLHEV